MGWRVGPTNPQEKSACACATTRRERRVWEGAAHMPAENEVEARPADEPDGSQQGTVTVTGARTGGVFSNSNNRMASATAAFSLSSG